METIDDDRDLSLLKRLIDGDKSVVLNEENYRLEEVKLAGLATSPAA